jgi:glycosyltransferase involved in cell wall biosynthesis
MSVERALRILLVADFSPRVDSGAAGTELAIQAELERQGHEVAAIWEDGISHRIRHWNLHHLLEQPRAIREAVGKALARRSFDVLHVNQPAGWRAARSAARSEPRALFVHRSHGYEPRIASALAPWRAQLGGSRRSPYRRLASAAMSRLLARNYRGIERWADAHVVSCGECAEYLVERGVAAEKILVSPQVPTASFFELPPAWTKERSKRILFVGQFALMKAPAVAAEAIGRLLKSDPELSATWVTDRAAHEAIRERLPTAARERLDLRDWMPRERLREVYDAHGLFLFTSYTEGFGKVFLEAMARGACVVATDQSGARDVVTHGVDGWLAPVADVDALVGGVRHLLLDDALAEAMSVRARRTAERYTWPVIVKALVGFYRVQMERLGIDPRISRD